jgi:two-component system, OmpR family, sensor histidine kinase KdpD
MKRFLRGPQRYDLDPLVDHPVLAVTLGLALVASLVPLLNLWRGTSGPLGPSIPVFFLAPVLLAAALGGPIVGVIVSIGALFAWDWYFIPPFHTVTVASARDLLTWAIFLAVALLTGQFAATARRRNRESLDRARSSEALYDLSAALIARRDLGEVLPAVTERLRNLFDLEACAIQLCDNNGIAWRTAAIAGSLPAEVGAGQSHSAAVLANGDSVHPEGDAPGKKGDGAAYPTVDQEHVRTLPLRVGPRSIGVLTLVQKPNIRPDEDQERLVATFANSVALALEQERLAAEEQTAAVARESDRLKSVLLSSVSHDLRTPLAGIKAAIGSLLRRDVQWNEEDRQAFLLDIDGEADRLTRLVANLLDISRIEAGAIRPRKEWDSIGELITRVISHLESLLGDHHVVIDVPDGLPPIRVDAVHIEQVLTNLLENAAKYSPLGTPITVRSRLDGEPNAASTLCISIVDLGPGIEPAEQKNIFEKFYRVTGSKRPVSGTGMGLAIVKGLVEAHGGHVSVESALGKGSTFTVVLPVERGDTAMSLSGKERQLP